MLPEVSPVTTPRVHRRRTTATGRPDLPHEPVEQFNVVRFPRLECFLEFSVAFYRALRDDIGLERLTEEPRVILLAAPHDAAQGGPFEVYMSDGALAIARAFDLDGTPGERVSAADLPKGCASFIGLIARAEATAVA